MHLDSFWSNWVMITQKDVNSKEYILDPYVTSLVWALVCVVADYSNCDVRLHPDCNWCYHWGFCYALCEVLHQSGSGLPSAVLVLHSREIWSMCMGLWNSCENNSHIFSYCHAEFGTCIRKGIIMLGSCKEIHNLLEHKNWPIQGSSFVILCFVFNWSMHYIILFC